MTEPLVASTAAVAVALSGHVLGMPAEAVALGAFASAAVILREEKKSLPLAVSSIFIGGLLGGALAPIVGRVVISHFAPDYAFLPRSEMTVAHVAAPVAIGLCWQVTVKVAMRLFPSVEKRFDDIVGAVVDFFIRKPKS